MLRMVADRLRAEWLGVFRGVKLPFGNGSYWARISKWVLRDAGVFCASMFRTHVWNLSSSESTEEIAAVAALPRNDGNTVRLLLCA